MKKLTLFLTVAGLLVFGASQAFAQSATASKSAAKTVTVVMHDPGCHWFVSHGKYVKSLTVAGPVKFANYDEKTVIVKGPKGTTLVKVGKSAPLAKGVYHITMVKQAPDDNHLVLTVN
jgi:hypothetical protein